MASACLNTATTDSKGLIQASALRGFPRSWQIHVNQIIKRMGLVQVKSDRCAFTRKDRLGHVNLVVMAYVDDLVVSGDQSASTNFKNIQETFSFKRIGFFNPGLSVEFLGRIIKKHQHGQSTIE